MMTEDTEDQIIYQRIGGLLWSIMPDDASEIYSHGQIYDYSNEICVDFRIKSSNEMAWFPFGEEPDEVIEEIMALAEDLRKLPPYESEPWTHFKVTITDAAKFQMQFAYIPEEDSWPGLYMRRVSELSEDELDEYAIPREDWEKAVKQFG